MTTLVLRLLVQVGEHDLAGFIVCLLGFKLQLAIAGSQDALSLGDLSNFVDKSEVYLLESLLTLDPLLC